jgi:HlyD family secretion protein
MSRLVKAGIGLLAVAILLGGAYYWRFLREIPVAIVQPRQNVEIRVFGIGTVEAQVLSRVGFQVAGKIVELGADQGDFVKAGTLLARLDDAAQRAKLLKSEAAVRQAAANLAKVEAQRERAAATLKQKITVNERRQSLSARGNVSQEAADDAETAAAIAKSDLAVVEADAAIARVLQDDAAAQQRVDSVLTDQHRLYAPFDARVITRAKELGGVANAGEPVFTLVAPETIWVRAYVDEASAGALAVGQTAFVRLRSDLGATVEAEVVRIDQENDRVTEERRVYVRCRACDPRHQLRYLGEQAEVEIVKAVIPSGRFVPLKDIRDYDGRAGTLWVLADGRLAKRRVQLGERTLDGHVRIAADLPANVAIVAGEGALLREGRAARPAAPER